MRVRQLSPTGDYTFGQGGQNYIANSPATVAQCVYTALQLFQGSWFLDTSAGVPWLTQVIGIGTEATYDVVVRNAILGVQGVLEILTYNSVLDGTTLNISGVSVNTIYGPVEVPPIGLPIPQGNGYGVGGYGNNDWGA